MKKRNLFKTAIATLMCVATVVVGLPSVVQAEEVTDKSWVSLHSENKSGIKYISADDHDVIVKYMGYDEIGDGEVVMFNDDTEVFFDWDKSLMTLDNYYMTDFYGLKFDRNDEGILEICEDESLGGCMYDGVSSNCGGMTFWNLSTTDFYKLKGFRGVTVDDIEIDENKYYYDMYIVRIGYYRSEEQKEGDYYSYRDFYYIPDDYSGVLELSDVPTYGTDTEDIFTDDAYIADFSDTDTKISASDFNAILEQNETNNVIIKSNNGVEFAFEKGTMSAVEDMEDYDFGTTLITDYDLAEETTPYVVKENFVAQINFNYSGKLPAVAYIKLPVGKEYAGKTLHYSQLSEDGIRYIQSATVDDDGFIIVKQDHCSDYVLTTEKPEVSEDNDNKTEENNETKSDDTGNKDSDNNITSDTNGNGGNTANISDDKKAEITSNDKNITSSSQETTNTNVVKEPANKAPQTGDSTKVYTWFMLLAISVGALSVSAKSKKANNS